MGTEIIENNSEFKKPHVAILPSPGMGHIIPLLEFAKQLVTVHGFHVTFLVFSTGSSPAQEKLLSSPSVPSGIDIVSLPKVDIPPFLRDEKASVSTKLRFIASETITKYLKSTLMRIKYGSPQALVVDMFCLSAFEITKELSVPAFLFVTTSASLLSWQLYYPAFDQSVNSDYTNLPETLRTPGSDSDLLVQDLKDGVMNREAIPHLKKFLEADGILINTWEDLEENTIFSLRNNAFYVSMKTPPIYPIGPIIKSKTNDGLEDGFGCLKWLDHQPKNSVLFISFGSGGTLTSEQTMELAYGLEQSKQRFIWVVRKPSNVSKSGSFFNVGSDDNDPESYLPDGFLENIETFGKIVTCWAPQTEVLSHESTGGFLTHCGWNSFLESCASGVPMICWPLFVDQMMNASMISNQLGVGVRVAVENHVVGRDEVERVVRFVMQGEEGKTMRRRASVLQKSALKSQVGASLDSLGTLVKEWSLAKQESLF